MDRVIPKDVVDLIYKESHHNNMKRLNAEYHILYWMDDSGNIKNILCYKHGNTHGTKHLNYRDTQYYRSFYYVSIRSFKRNNSTGKLPKMYFFSSGHSELKWIE